MFNPITIFASLELGSSRFMDRSCRLRFRSDPELLFVIIIITLLATLAIKNYLPTIGSAKVIQAVGGATFQTARLDSAVYYALNGTWPQDTAAAQSIGLHPNYKGGPQEPVRSATLSNGAINLHLTGDFADKTLTLRPAMPAGENATVIWVCGADRSEHEWAIAGEDQTRLDFRYINRHLW